ncbi:MAG: hypothetical protein KDK70_06440 [Myxococcales bacterium]|nr:hypothetical protein [Myxococcales bacterium]
MLTRAPRCSLRLVPLLLLLGGCVRAVGMPRSTPVQRVENAAPEEAWVELRRERCTGRRQFHDPDCESYTIRVHADGRVEWEGLAFVQTLGPSTHQIPASDARRLIDRTERRLPGLAARECAVDHAHYVGIRVGRPGQAEIDDYWGCGARYMAAARPIDRVADSRWLR